MLFAVACAGPPVNCQKFDTDCREVTRMATELIDQPSYTVGLFELRRANVNLRPDMMMFEHKHADKQCVAEFARCKQAMEKFQKRAAEFKAQHPTKNAP